nr:helix-turn-helix domain-containing protein [uncultured Roseibium sp.]
MNDLVTLANMGSFDRIDLTDLTAERFDTNDFDHHASLYRGIDAKMMQLSEGVFMGQLLRGLSERASVQLSVCNQSVEQHIVADANSFVFCICPDGTDSPAVFGNSAAVSWVFVLPPRGEAVAVLPAMVPLLIMTVDREMLLRSDSLLPEIAAWFENLAPDGETISSQVLVSRLTGDALLKLRSGAGLRAQEQIHTLDQLAVSNIANSLSLEWLKKSGFHIPRRSAALERFVKARLIVRQNPNNLTGNTQHPIFELGSKRSVEQAFAERVGMGPLSYARLVRLHNARQKLRDGKLDRESIGNIAAQEGFWEWSRFTSYYGRHFGELPSQTREHATRLTESRQALAG